MEHLHQEKTTFFFLNPPTFAKTNSSICPKTAFTFQNVNKSFLLPSFASLWTEKVFFSFCPEFFCPVSDSLKSRRMLGTNVTVVIKGRSSGSPGKIPELCSPLLSLCEWHCLCFTYLRQMLAEWNWIPGNEGERSHHTSFSFYVWGQDFSWPALIPWLSVLRCCCWIMTRVEGETGFFLSHGAEGPLSLGCYELNSSFSRKQKNLFHSVMKN